MELHLALCLVIGNFERTMVWDTLSVGPTARGEIRIDPEFDDCAAATFANLITKITAVGLTLLAVPTGLHELVRVLPVAYRNDDSMRAADAVFRRYRTVGIGLA